MTHADAVHLIAELHGIHQVLAFIAGSLVVTGAGVWVK